MPRDGYTTFSLPSPAHNAVLHAKNLIRERGFGVVPHALLSPTACPSCRAARRTLREDVDATVHFLRCANCGFTQQLRTGVEISNGLVIGLSVAALLGAIHDGAR